MEFINKFKNYLLSQKNKPSLVTVKNYLADIKQFVTWFEHTYNHEFTPKTISMQVINEFKTEKLQVLSASSLDRHISSLRKFFTFLKLDGQIAHSPFDAVPSASEMAGKSDPWHLHEFKNYLYVYNASSLTIKNYLIDVKQFLHWAEEVTGVEDAWRVEDKNILSKVDNSLIEEYKARLLRQGAFSASSINRKLSSLRKYLSWAAEAGYLSHTSLFGNVSNVSQDKVIGDQQAFASQIDYSSMENADKTIQSQAKYSKIPPIRLFQKLAQVSTFTFDLLIVAPIAFLFRKVEHGTWVMQGKPLFKKASKFSLPVFTAQTARLHEQINRLRFKPTVKNITKDIYAPLSMSTRDFPWYKKLFFHARYTRPQWYHKYHQLAIAHYFNWAVLIIFSAAIGFGMYNSFVKTPGKSLAALPTAGKRILSFQGRLTDASDNPITTPSWIRFAVYNDTSASGSARLWEEVDKVNPDQDGIFSIYLGSDNAGGEAPLCNGGNPPASPATGACGIPQSLFAQNSALWLGVTVENKPELTPREQIATVAYAVNAETLQGLPPITQSGAGTSNVVLALNSSGNLSIGGSTTFQATSGTFSLSGNTLTLNTNPGTNGNITLAPDGQGYIDIQKPIQNSTLNNNISSAAGAVEVDDLMAILATSGGQSALTINQNGSGPIISASHSGTAEFTVDSTGNGTFNGNVTGQTIYTGGGVTYYINNTTSHLNSLTLAGSFAVSGNVASDLIPATSDTYSLGSDPAASGKEWLNLYVKNIYSNGQALTQLWQRLGGVVAPLNITDDLAIGGTATGSALFQVSGTTGNATTSGNLTFAGTAATNLIATRNNTSLTIGDNQTGNIFLSPQGGSGILTLNGNFVQTGNTTLTTGTGLTTIGGNLTVNGTTQTVGNGGNYTIQTTTNGSLSLFSAGTGNITLGQNAGTGNVVVQPNAGGLAALIVNKQNTVGDIFTASSSGTPKFTIANDGTLKNDLVPNQNNTYSLGQNPATGNQWLNLYAKNIYSDGQLITSYWQRNVGVLAPLNITDDLVIGGTATGAAKFQVFGLTGNATTSGNLTFNSNAVIQTTSMLPLVLGSTTTGSVQLAPKGTTGVYVDGTGNVGIGTTSTQSLVTLASAGSLQIGQTSDSSYSLLDNNDLKFNKTNNSYISQVAGGTLRVGIGAISSNSNGLTINPANSVGINTTTYGNVALAVNQANLSGAGDIFTASASGTTEFTIKNDGTLVSGKYTTAGGVFYTDTNGTFTQASNASANTVLHGGSTPTFSAVDLNNDTTGVVPLTKGGTGANLTGDQGGIVYFNSNTTLAVLNHTALTGQCLVSNGTAAPSWSTCATGSAGTNYWQLAAGALSPIYPSTDLLVGALATSSAKFAVTGIAGSLTPAASVSATVASGGTGTGIVIKGDSTIQSLINSQLTIGGNTTGNITLSPLNGAGSVTVNGTTLDTTASNFTLLSGASVLNIGAANGTTSFGSSAINTTQSSLTLFANPTTVNFAGAATTLNLGVSGGTTTVLGAETVNGNVTLGTNSSNTVVINGLVSGAGANNALQPSGNGTTDLGSATHYWNTVYAQNFISPVSGGTSGFWQLTNSVLSPVNFWNDLAVGGNATNSATPFQVFASSYTNDFGTVPAGTATSSGNLTFRGTNTAINLLNGSGLTINYSAGGDKGITTIAALATNGSLTLSGNLAVNGGTISSTNTTDNLFTGASFITVGGSGTASTLNGSLTLGTSTSNTITFNGVVSSDILPRTTGGPYNLGSNTNRWGSVYTNNVFLPAQGGTGGYWTLASSVLSPTNSWNDLAIGGTATGSAAFQVFANAYTNNAGVVPAGTATTSGNLVFTGSNNKINLLNNDTLGIYNSVGGNIGLSANPTLFIANTGNVGIGTNNPTSPLHISIDSSSIPDLLLGGGTNTANYISISGGAGVVGYDGSQTVLKGGTGHGLSLYVNAPSLSTGTQAEFISAPGFVGIGTTLQGNAQLAVNQTNTSGLGDIFTASAAGSTKFTIANDGSIKNSLVPNLIGASGIDTIYNLGASNAEWDTLYVRQIVSPSGGGTSGYWQLSNTGVLAPTIMSNDLQIGASDGFTVATSSALFHVYATTQGGIAGGTASTAANLTFIGTNVSNAAKVNLLNNSTLGFYNSVGGDAGLNAAPSLFIAANSNVGIGTNSTQSLLTLASSGSLQIGQTTDSLYTLLDNNDLKFNRASNSYITQMTGGTLRVGIGSISSTSNGLTITPINSFGINTTTPGNAALAVNQAGISGLGDIFTASASGTTKFVITNDGNVGIGNLNDNTILAKTGLQVQKDSLGNALAYLQQLGNGDILTASNSANATELQLTNQGQFFARNLYDLDNPIYYIDPAGLTVSASVAGSLTFTPASEHDVNFLNNSNFNFQSSPGGDAGLSSRLFIQGSTGDVGLGTTSPTQKLDVVGDAQVGKDAITWGIANYLYRRQISIANTYGQALIGYQVKIVIDTASLIAAGKMRSDCIDTRFTDIDGSTSLNFWRESGCNTNATTYWVQVPSIPGPTKTIYFYYGHSSEFLDKSSASSVFNYNIANVQAAYRFDEPVAGETVDYSGNGLAGLDTGTTVVTGEFNNARSFNGSSDKISLTTSATLNLSTFTYAAWINVTNVSSNRPIIGSNSGSGVEFRVNTSGKLELLKQGIASLATSTGTITNGTWTYVAVTYNNSTGAYAFYINGSVSGSGTIATQTFTFSNDLIGSATSVSEFFLGSIDEARIYSSPLSSTDISTMYGTGGNIVGYVTPAFPNTEFPRQYVSPEPSLLLGVEQNSLQNIPSFYVQQSTGNVSLGSTSVGTSSALLTVAGDIKSGLYDPTPWSTTNYKSWLYRSRITVDNTASASALTNYQVQVTVNTAAPIALGKMRSDCNDIRFADGDGDTALNYWIETGSSSCNSTSTTIWVKVPSIPAASLKHIYMYYGNSSAAAASSGTNTFSLFDDFNTLDTVNTWSTTGGTTSVSNSQLTVSTGAVYSQATQAGEPGTIVESRMSWGTAGSGASDCGGLGTSNANSLGTSNANSNKTTLVAACNSTNVQNFAGNGSAASFNLLSSGTVFTETPSTFYIVGQAVDSRGVYFYQNRSQTDSASGSFIGNQFLILGDYKGSTTGTTNAQDVTFDWVLVRQFSATPPTTTVDSEQDTSQVDPTLYVNNTFNRVGINTANPTTTLDVALAGTGTGTSIARLLQPNLPDSGYTNAILFGKDNTVNGQAGDIQYVLGTSANSYSDSYIDITNIGDTNGIVIKKGGNVGIGTNNPNSSTKLEIVGSGGRTNTPSGSNQFIIESQSGEGGMNLFMGTDTSNFTTYISSYQGTGTTKPLELNHNGGTVAIGNDNFSKTLTVGASCTNTGTNSCIDYAEYYNSSEIVDAGDILSFDTSSASGKLVKKATEPYSTKTMGIVSTNPAIVIEEGNIGVGTSLGTNGQNYVQPSYKPPVALAGRVPVKVSTINGPLHIGDMVTASIYAGFGMKATHAGSVVGRVMQEFDPNNGNIGEGVIACPAGTPSDITCGKIFVYVNTSWYDPDVYLTTTGDLQITDSNLSADFTIPHYYTISDALGNPIQRMGAFVELVVGNLRAGSVNAQQVLTNSLAIATANITVAGQSLHDYIISVVKDAGLTSGNVAQSNSVKTNIISPLDGSDIVIRLNNSGIEIAKDASSSAVASFDNNGNASFSGQLSGQNLAVNGDATVSGTLHADKIEANSIVGLQAAVGTLSAQNITNVTNIYFATPSAAPMPANTITGSNNISTASSSMLAANNFTNVASFSAYLSYVPNLNTATSTVTNGFTSSGSTNLGDTSISGQLAIGGQMIFADNSLNVLGNDFAIQPLKQGGVTFEGGLIAIDTSGNLTVNGSATFNGNVAVNTLSPLPGHDLNISLPDNSQLAMHNASGSAVFAVNQEGDVAAQGSANISKLNFNLVQPALAVSDIEVVASGSAGTAAIKANQTELTIDNKNVTANSLIYITPVGTSQTPYLLRQVSGKSFTVGIPAAQSTAVNFNWLIVN